MNGSANSNIVATGCGMATCLGLDVDTVWQAVLRGECGIGPMPALEQTPQPNKGGGQAPDLPADFAADQPREVRYLRWVIDAALRDAGLLDARDADAPPLRVGVVLGTTLHGMRAAGRFLRSDNAADLAPFLAGSTLAAAVNGLPSWFKIVNTATTCSACSSALAAVAIGCTWLEADACEIVIAGGYDTVSEYVYAGFNSLRLVAEGPQRPFAHDRDGMKVAEGYGVVVLERDAVAASRGATPRAVIAGFGETADTHHLTQPHPTGDGAARAMREAIDSARLAPADIQLVSAHATATSDNDAAEHAACRAVFGDGLRDVAVTAYKSHQGHTLGAAGLVELLLTMRAMHDGRVPPVANVAPDDVTFDGLSLVTGSTPQPRDVSAAMGVSLGFGGANAADGDHAAARARRRGVGRVAVVDAAACRDHRRGCGAAWRCRHRIAWRRTADRARARRRQRRAGRACECPPRPSHQPLREAADRRRHAGVS